MNNQFKNKSMEINSRDHKFADLALNEASNSNMKYHKHGCVAVCSGVVIAKGHNSDRCYSKDGFLHDTCSCHAEIDVVRKLYRMQKNNVMSGVIEHNSAFYNRISLYVVRKSNCGKYYKDSAPCERCTLIIKSLNIKNIIFSNENGTLSKYRVKNYYSIHESQGNRYLYRNMKERGEENKSDPEKKHEIKIKSLNKIAHIVQLNKLFPKN